MAAISQTSRPNFPYFVHDFIQKSWFRILGRNSSVYAAFGLFLVFLTCPVSPTSLLDAIDTAMLACAMFAIGTQTHVPMLLKSGVRPLLCAAVLWVGLVAGGAAINAGVRWLAG